MKNAKFWAVGMVVLLSGCEDPRQYDTWLDSGVMEVKITQVSPGKQFRFSFVNPATFNHYSSHVSVRCANQAGISIGKMYKLGYVVKKKADGSQYTEFPDIAKNFCPK